MAKRSCRSAILSEAGFNPKRQPRVDLYGRSSAFHDCIPSILSRQVDGGRALQQYMGMLAVIKENKDGGRGKGRVDFNNEKKSKTKSQSRENSVPECSYPQYDRSTSVSISSLEIAPMLQKCTSCKGRC